METAPIVVAKGTVGELWNLEFLDLPMVMSLMKHAGLVAVFISPFQSQPLTLVPEN
jgi:hypothetical protein